MFKCRVFLFAALGAIGFSNGASAQTRLPDIFQRAAEMRAGLASGPPGSRSPWLFEQLGNIRGKGCTLFYFQGDQMMLVVGPNVGGNITNDENESIAVLLGPNIPLPRGNQIRRQSVKIKNEGEPARTVRAILAPNLSRDHGGGTIMLYMKSIEDILRTMKDSQSFGVDVNNRPAVNLQWTDAMPQINRLRACIGGSSS